ncbi:hypothetical protein MKW94_002232 [Papaver nudicaule]|uniref:Uncharacterized protein n=1 Tax=Papaver nudicaule TaxID=74823 RepID=A0AA41SHF6_PAPNU|nr:hypothetical protein [Papaver nudicaule]
MGMGRVCKVNSSVPSSAGASGSSSGYPSTPSLTTSTSLTETGLGNVGGYAWAIYFYPDGKSLEENAAYVSLFLLVKVHMLGLFCELTVLDQSGKEMHKVHSHFGRTLESGPVACGTQNLFHISTSFHIKISARSSITCILSQLFGPMKDQNTRCINMEAPVFKPIGFVLLSGLALAVMLLSRILELTGLTTKWASTLMAQHLLAAADRYGLERLRLLCEAKLCEDVATSLLSTKVSLSQIPVMQTDGFEYLKESCPAVLTELLEYVARDGVHSVAICRHETMLDRSDVNGRRVKQRI